MASSEKTEKLGLSLWSAADKPERLDFVQDNQKLEQIVGGHIGNLAAHLTTGEKEFLNRPYSITTYVGSGSSTRTFRSLPGNKVPYMILGLCQEHPPCVPGGSGTLDVYWDFWLSAGNNINLGGGGILVDEVAKTITVKNGVKATASAWTPCTRNLNANGALYVLLLFYNVP